MKNIIIISVFTILFSFIIQCSAEAVTFFPTPSNFDNLDHYRYTLWGIQWTVPSNEEIVGASFYIDDINNWRTEANDQLFIGILDNAPVGVTTYYDGQATSNAIETYASNNNIEYWHLDTYTDLIDSPGPAENYVYNFSDDDLNYFNNFVIDGLVAVGLDADCHYWNSGARLVIETSPVVPEPATLSLTLLGLLSGIGLRKRN